MPIGDQGLNAAGETPEFDKADLGRRTVRAILDIGLLDVNPRYLRPDDPGVRVIDAGSDMLVVGLGKNPKGYKSGGILSFQLRYMGVLGAMNSNSIEKLMK